MTNISVCERALILFNGRVSISSFYLTCFCITSYAHSIQAARKRFPVSPYAGLDFLRSPRPICAGKPGTGPRAGGPTQPGGCCRSCCIQSKCSAPQPFDENVIKTPARPSMLILILLPVKTPLSSCKVN